MAFGKVAGDDDVKVCRRFTTKFTPRRAYDLRCDQRPGALAELQVACLSVC